MTKARSLARLNGPAFSAYQSSAQTLSSTTFTKIQLQTKEFDTASAFDNVTNFRFQPAVAGYYQINGSIQINVAATQVITLLYKNGSIYKQGSNANSSGCAVVSSIVYFNGSTDYVELYGYISSGQVLAGGVFYTYLNGAMMRAA